jgi:NO-binding membrane sensor protein with MHYT domain
VGGALGFPLAKVSSLAFDSSTHTLFGIDRDLMSAEDKLVAIDGTTGAATVVGSGSLGFHFVQSLAFAPAIPEPSTAVLTALGLIAGVSLVGTRSGR